MADFCYNVTRLGNLCGKKAERAFSISQLSYPLWTNVPNHSLSFLRFPSPKRARWLGIFVLQQDEGGLENVTEFG